MYMKLIQCILFFFIDKFPRYVIFKIDGNLTHFYYKIFSILTSFIDYY